MPKINFFYDDIAMRYEALAIAVFNCERWQDPFHIANQTLYGVMIDASKPDARRPLSIVLHKMGFDHPESDEVRALEERLWEAKKQGDFIDIIEDAITLYESWD